MIDVVAVVGKPSAGKTTLARRLARELAWRRWSIDQERGRGGDWNTYPLAVLNRAPVVAESVRVPEIYAAALEGRGLVIVCDCLEHVRLLREAERGRPVRVTYDAAIHADVIVDTTRPVAPATVRDLVARVNHHDESSPLFGRPRVRVD